MTGRGRHVRSPRNHARRVEDLQALEALDVLRFLESRREGGAWEYVVHVTGEDAPRAIPTGRVDAWLAGVWAALTAIGRLPDASSGQTGPAGSAGHATGSGTTPTEEPTHAR